MVEHLIRPEKRFFGPLLGPASERDAIGNYAGDPAVWSIQNQRPASYAVIQRMCWLMIFTADTDFHNYGPIVDGLPVGIKVQVNHDGWENPITLVQGTIQTNLDLVLLAGSQSGAPYDDHPQAGNEGALLFEFGVVSASRGLALAPGERIELIMQDDLSLLTNHQFDVNGFFVDQASVRSASGASAYVI